ncbi:MAG: ATP-binding protein [Prevotellaceae bacterium]|jgi:DNA transposition AAA+ family ATPase|nr:ATP-binding protein [Prevotellaceae bacterium]
MQNSEKKQIQAKLAEYCELKGSQNKAANTMKGVSAATISQMLNNNWDLITDEMWRTVAAYIGYEQEASKWVVVETRGYARMTALLADAQQNALVFAVTGEAGCGKSEAIKSYARSHTGVFNLSCSEFWTRKYFMQELLAAMGIDNTGCGVPEMMSEIIYHLKRKETPLIVLDEADKLSDQLLYFFISIYNQLEDHCGIILCATDFLEKRIKRGLRTNKRGYKEIYSRCGRRFIPMQVVSDGDVAAVCSANGVTDRKEIEKIITDCECDLRRVKRRVHAYKTKN